MGCCDTLPASTAAQTTEPTTTTITPDALRRRTVLKGMLAGMVGLSLGGSSLGFAQRRGDRIRLAFCSQLLCVVPYEFTQAQGFFEDEGLDVELVYTRGGNAAMQALVGGAVDYAATSFDVALQAFANNADIRRFATTGRLPLFALAVAPKNADTITEVSDLAGTTVGVSALGNADHAMLLYLLAQAGVDANSVRFATLGPNLYDALRIGQIDAGMVQEPALSLLADQGGRELVNAMKIEDAERYLGGAYEFMGVAYRTEEREERLEQMQALARALSGGLRAVKAASTREIVDALPSELIAGGDTAQLETILETYRGSLYPDTVAIDYDTCDRVQQAHLTAGILDAPIDLDTLLDEEVIGQTEGVGESVGG
ncbi:MAG: ABC transporter substrate-binding protein [Trueperaceae bacterium]|nr:ABC transporter substrate-binding protein [Trueperaceae bacterium]